MVYICAYIHEPCLTDSEDICVHQLVCTAILDHMVSIRIAHLMGAHFHQQSSIQAYVCSLAGQTVSHRESLAGQIPIPLSFLTPPRILGAYNASRCLSER